jgi:hypothetical protein
MLVLGRQRFLRVVAGSVPINKDSWFVTNDPGIMTRRKVRYISFFKIKLCPISHFHMQHSRNKILEMWSFAPFRVSSSFTSFDHFHPGFKTKRLRFLPRFPSLRLFHLQSFVSRCHFRSSFALLFHFELTRTR